MNFIRKSIKLSELIETTGRKELFLKSERFMLDQDVSLRTEAEPSSAPSSKGSKLVSKSESRPSKKVINQTSSENSNQTQEKSKAAKIGLL